MTDPSESKDMIVRGLRFTCEKPRVWRVSLTSHTKLLLEKWTERISTTVRRDNWTCTVEGLSGEFGRISSTPDGAVLDAFSELRRREDDLKARVAAFPA